LRNGNSSRQTSLALFRNVFWRLGIALEYGLTPRPSDFLSRRCFCLLQIPDKTDQTPRG
jgi:hypothetical protein